MFDKHAEKGKREESLRKFSISLRASLILEYGQVPSASRFADEYNLRAHGTATISRETARKWIRGNAFPEIDKLSILVSWLGLDLYEFLPISTNQTNVSTHLTPIKRLKQYHNVENAREDIMKMIDKLDVDSMEVILILALALYESKKIVFKERITSDSPD